MVAPLLCFAAHAFRQADATLAAPTHACALHATQDEAAQCEPLRDQVQSLERQHLERQAELRAAHQQLQALSDRVSAAK